MNLINAWTVEDKQNIKFNIIIKIGSITLIETCYDSSIPELKLILLNIGFTHKFSK